VSSLRPSFRGAAIALALALVAPATTRAEPKPDRFDTQLGNVDAALARLERLYARPDASLRAFSIQKRLVDARVFYELGQYENTAMVLIDIVDRPEFATSLDYDASLLLLGQSLFELGNLNAARDVLKRVTMGREPEVADEARLHLLEIALSTGRQDEIARAIQDTPLTVRSDRLKYGLGKAFFHLGRHAEAASQLSAITPGSEFHMRARYFLGATAVATADYDRALEIYRGIVTLPAEDEVSTKIRDEAWLAIGRLLVQKKSYALALTSYQNIGRNSPFYETALLEMAWAYINQEAWDKALQMVDVLLLNVSNPNTDVEANILRGQLNVARQDYEEAIGAYQDIIDRFAPIRNELARFVSNPMDVRRYFEWLTRRRGDLAALQSPLSDRTVKWLETSSDLARVSNVFAGLAEERQSITEANLIGGELKEILSDRGRVEVFPELKEGWARLQVAENQLILMLVGLLDEQRDELKMKVDAAERAEFDAAHAERQQLTRGGLRLPSTFEAFNERHDVAVSKFRELAQRHFLVQKGMDELQRQLLAIERELNRRQFAEEGEKFSPMWEEELRNEIAREKQSLQAVYDELVALSREIDVETRKLGAGDTASAGEQTLKQQLLRAIEREGRSHDRIAQRLGGKVATRYVGLEGVRRRSGELFGRISRLLGLISGEVRKKTDELLAVVDGELRQLSSYDGEAGLLVADGDDIASRYGMAFFDASLARMSDVVLDADVGLLDVVWARKTEQTAALQRLNEDRARRLKGLQDSLESIKSGAGDEPAPDAIGGSAP
jgi:tetratricopeptide (TPR) repeat protein